MSKVATPLIKAQPGYILATPYLQEGKTFVSNKEITGEDQKSVILDIGAPVLDDKGNYRHAKCNVGDIIIHSDSNKTFEIDFQKYRFVHFTEVHGIWNVK